MLDGLAKLFAGRRKERRHSPRQQVRFTLSVLKGGERIPGIGLEISLNGCLIATQEPPAAATFRAILNIDAREVPVQLNSVHSGKIVHEGKLWTALGCSFSGVARDDYDVLVGFLKGTASRSSSGAGRMNGEAGSA